MYSVSMKYSHRFREKNNWNPFKEERIDWMDEYDKGFNDGKLSRYDDVFWVAVIWGACVGIIFVGLFCLI